MRIPQILVQTGLQPTDANTPIAIVSDTAVSSTPAGYGVELYSGASFPDDQFAAATIDAFGVISDISLFIRDDLTNTTGYYITVSGDGSGNYFLDLVDSVADIDLYPEISLSGAPQPGDLITIQVVGTLVTAFYNSVPVASGTSTTTTSGSSVLSVVQSAIQTDTSLSLFTAGSMTLPSPPDSIGAGVPLGNVIFDYDPNGSRNILCELQISTLV